MNEIPDIMFLSLLYASILAISIFGNVWMWLELKEKERVMNLAIKEVRELREKERKKHDEPAAEKQTKNKNSFCIW